MRTPVRYSTVIASLRPSALLHIVTTMIDPPFYGAVVVLMPDGTVHVSGSGLRLRRVVREKIGTDIAPDLITLGQAAAQIAAAFDAKTTAAGLRLPFRNIQASGGYLTPSTNLEVGGVGAGMASFYLDHGGSLILRVPPRAVPGEGRPLAPATAAAQVRWDANWAPAHVESLKRLLGADAEAALRHFHALTDRLPDTLDFGH